MKTLALDLTATHADQVKQALNVFPFLQETGAVNLVLWLLDHPSMSGVISYSELETLEGVVY